jgi:hypothetical protein
MSDAFRIHVDSRDEAGAVDGVGQCALTLAFARLRDVEDSDFAVGIAQEAVVYAACVARIACDLSAVVDGSGAGASGPLETG